MKKLLFAGALIIGGCSTPYQEMGLAGGVAAYPMTADTFRIEARGNGYTSSTAMHDYTLLKAAETTKAAGATHFVMISGEDATTTGAVVLPGEARTSFHGNTAYTSYSPPSAIKINKPGQNTYIRILKLEPGQPPPQGAQSADEVIQFVGSRVKRG